MSKGPFQLLGLQFRIGKYKFRVWKHGFEYGDDCGGRVRFFPWAPHLLRMKREKFYVWLAWKLPKELAKWAFIRVSSADTSKHPDEVTYQSAAIYWRDIK